MQIMTLEQLRNFCRENKLLSFEAKESDSELIVSVPYQTNFSLDDGGDQYGLRHFECFAYHSGLNKNHSYISEELFVEKLKSLKNKPILAYVVADSKSENLDFCGHSMLVDWDENGEHITYLEQPVGFVSDKGELVYDEEQKVHRAKVSGFLFEQYCKPVTDIITKREHDTVDVSIELSVNDMEYDFDEDRMVFKDYDVSGIALLGANQKPGMEGSHLTIDFSSTDDDTKKGGKTMDEEAKVDELVEETFEETEPETVEEETVEEEVEVENDVENDVNDDVENDVEEEEEVKEEEEEEVETEPEIDLNALKLELQSLKEQNAQLINKVETYEKAEADAQKEVILADPSYAEFKEEPEFVELFSKKDELTVEELKTKAELAFASAVKHKHFDKEPERKSSRFSLGDSKSKPRSRYGNFTVKNSKGE